MQLKEYWSNPEASEQNRSPPGVQGGSRGTKHCCAKAGGLLQRAGDAAVPRSSAQQDGALCFPRRHRETARRLPP